MLSHESTFPSILRPRPLELIEPSPTSIMELINKLPPASEVIKSKSTQKKKVVAINVQLRKDITEDPQEEVKVTG